MVQLLFAACACGLIQSTGLLERNFGKCILCGKEVDDSDPEPMTFGKPIPAGVLAAEPHQPACAECGARLSETNVGVFWPCGHSPTRHQAKEEKEKPKMARRMLKTPEVKRDATDEAHDKAEREAIEDEVTNRGGADPAPEFPPLDPSPEGSPLKGVLAGQEVTVTWGEELFSPMQFHTFKVGPFSATTRVLPGETFEKAAARAMSDLQRFAEMERERKRASYLKIVETMKR